MILKSQNMPLKMLYKPFKFFLHRGRFYQQKNRLHGYYSFFTGTNCWYHEGNLNFLKNRFFSRQEKINASK